MTAWLPDTNVWLAASIDQHTHHNAAKAWLDSIPDVDSVVFCEATRLSFLRLLTTAAVFRAHGVEPLNNQDALAVYDALQADDRVAFTTPGLAAADDAWRRWADHPNPSPKLWMDAWLAAVAHTTEATLVTFDAAFRHYAGLRAEILN